MPQLPVLSGLETVRNFEQFGWSVARQRGGHIIMNKPGEMATLGGLPDVCGRDAYTAQHGHGSMNIAKVVLARQLGISRTQR